MMIPSDDDCRAAEADGIQSLPSFPMRDTLMAVRLLDGVSEIVEYLTEYKYGYAISMLDESVQDDWWNSFYTKLPQKVRENILAEAKQLVIEAFDRATGPTDNDS